MTSTTISSYNNTSHDSFFSSFVKKIIFPFSLFLLPVGLLFGEVPTSVAEIIVFAIWLISSYWKNIPALKNNIFFWILSNLYFIHIIGLIYTSDFNYALNDLRIKIPLLLFPLLFFTSTISSHTIIQLLKWFGIVVLINLLYLYTYHLCNSSNNIDSRKVSLFISHIRLGLIASFAVVTSVFITINFTSSFTQKIIFSIIAIITLLLILLLGLITGITSLVVATLFALIYMIIRKNNPMYIRLFSIVIISFITLGFFYFQHIYKKYFPEIKNQSELTHTAHQNPYFHSAEPYTENGYYVFQNICDVELKKEWEKRSPLPFNGKDKKQNELKYTLYRYLTSKGLTKDSTGLAQLNNQDIKNIENGYPNYLYVTANFLEKRIYEFIQEYKYFQASRDPNGKTIVLRLFYWKIAFNIWKKNFWWGVGTGDVRQSYEKEYLNHPNIHSTSQLRAHNQIITYALTFGIPGLLIILLTIIYPLIKLKHTKHFLLYFMLTIINILSFLIDDTFETQPGVTFYALFNTLLIKFLTNQSN